MTQEEKQLLLKELCARLPYGVMCKLSVKDVDISITEKLDTGGLEHFIYGTMDVKPYLRPMSSMTEEERTKIAVLSKFNELTKSADFAECSSVVVDYCNSRQLDYRGLIEKGLALESPEDMYK